MDEEVTPTLPMPPGADIDRLRRALLERFQNPAPEAPHLADRHGRLAETAAAAARHPSGPACARTGRIDTARRSRVAAWMRYVTGNGRAGARHRRARPHGGASARRSPTGQGARPRNWPVSLFGVREIFGGDLPQDPRFTGAVTENVARLYDLERQANRRGVQGRLAFRYPPHHHRPRAGDPDPKDAVVIQEPLCPHDA